MRTIRTVNTNIKQTLTMTHSAPSFTQGKYVRKWAQREPRSKSGHCKHVNLLQNTILNRFSMIKKLFQKNIKPFHIISVLPNRLKVNKKIQFIHLEIEFKIEAVEVTTSMIIKQWSSDSSRLRTLGYRYSFTHDSSYMPYTE